jgi:hypothetical protein
MRVFPNYAKLYLDTLLVSDAQGARATLHTSKSAETINWHSVTVLTQSMHIEELILKYHVVTFTADSGS